MAAETFSANSMKRFCTAVSIDASCQDWLHIVLTRRTYHFVFAWTRCCAGAQKHAAVLILHPGSENATRTSFCSSVKRARRRAAPADAEQVPNASWSCSFNALGTMKGGALGACAVPHTMHNMWLAADNVSPCRVLTTVCCAVTIAVISKMHQQPGRVNISRDLLFCARVRPCLTCTVYAYTTLGYV
jgi:hypothetical protein